MKLSNLTQVKTTVLGVIIILADLYYWLFQDAHNTTIFFGVLGLGLALLFAPDTLIKGITALINRNKEKDVL